MSDASGAQGSFSTDLFSDNRYAELTSLFDKNEVRLRELAGTERVGEPFAYEIKMISREPIRDLAPVVGTRMTVGLKLKDGSNRYFNGLVTSFRFIGIDETRRTNYLAEVRSMAHAAGLPAELPRVSEQDGAGHHQGHLCRAPSGALSGRNPA